MNPLKFFKAMLTPVPRLTPADCAARIHAGEALLIDVREAREWTDGVAQQATLLPLSDLQGARTQWQPFLARAGQRELFIYCAVGGRAGFSCASAFSQPMVSSDCMTLNSSLRCSGAFNGP